MKAFAIMEKVPILKCLIAGYEHGGTTVLSEILRQHPDVDGRFETGLLLTNNLPEFPDSYPAYAGFIRDFWKVTPEELDEICQSGSWEKAYSLLAEKSKIPNGVQIYDKTPRYMSILEKVLEKVDVPAVIIIRDPCAVFWSHHKRSLWHDGLPVGRYVGLRDACRIKPYCNYYLRYADGLDSALSKFPDRIHVVRYEELCGNPESEAKNIFDFLNLDFDPDYLKILNKYEKHTNVKDGGICTDFLREFEDHIDQTTIDSIRTGTLAKSEWWI
jgi:hypothetical protein